MNLYSTLRTGLAMLALGFAGCGTKYPEQPERDAIKEAETTHRALVADGYKGCPFNSKGGHAFVGADTDRNTCFTLDEMKYLKQAGVPVNVANLFTGVLDADLVELYRTQGDKRCDFGKLSSIAATVKKEDDKETFRLAKLVCTGAAKIEDVLAYDKRFDAWEIEGFIEDRVSPQKANCYSSDLNAQTIRYFVQDRLTCDQEKTYAALREKTKMGLISRALNDCSYNVETAAKLELSPKTIEWYSALNERFPEISLDLCDMAAFESEKKKGEITEAEIVQLASEMNQRLKRKQREARFE